MAIITQLSKCPICGNQFSEDYESENIFGLPASGLDFLGEYVEFNDAGLHQTCFQNWEKAIAFVEHWNENMKGCENYKHLRLCILPNGKLEYETRSKLRKNT